MGDVRAEWTRLWSLRSPAACLAGAVAAFMLCALALANDAVRAVELGEVPAGTVTSPVDVVGPATQVAIGLVVAFAMLPVTGEYACGSMRTTVLAQPRRRRALAAKTAVVALAAGIVLALAALGGWVVTAAILGERLDASVGRAALVGRMALLGALVAIVGSALGAMLRSSAATVAVGVAVFVGLLVVPDPVGSLLPATAAAGWVEHGGLAGLAVLLAWSALFWLAGAAMMATRDV